MESYETIEEKNETDQVTEAPEVVFLTSKNKRLGRSKKAKNYVEEYHDHFGSDHDSYGTCCDGC